MKWDCGVRRVKPEKNNRRALGKERHPRRGDAVLPGPYHDIIIGKGFGNVNVGGRSKQAYLLYVVDTQG
jgi:hypothetical protein